MFGDPRYPAVGMLPNVPQLRPLSPFAAPALNIPLPQKPGLLSRLQSALFPLPQGAEDMMSQDDIASARAQGLLGLGRGLLEMSGPVVGAPAPSLGQAIAHGIQRGQEATGAAVQNGLMMDERKLQLQKLQARQRVAQMFPMRANESKDQTIDRLRGMMAALVQLGDMEGAGKIGEYLKSVDNDQTRKLNPQEIRLGDRVILRDPSTGQQVGEYKINPSPRDPNAPDTAQQLREQRKFNQQEKLMDDFNKDTASQRQSAVKLVGAIGERDAAKKGDGAAQINILYAFVNAMDPASAVREGEIGLARAAAPVWAQVQQYFNKYLSTGSVVVPPALIDRMVDLMGRRLTSYNNYVKERSDYYTARAKSRGVHEDGLFPLLPSADGPAQKTGNRLLNP